MERRSVTVLLCGLRRDFDQAIANRNFYDWLPADRVFRENAGAPGSSTLTAVRFAYDLLGDDVCATCPRRKPVEPDNGAFYYVI